MRSSRPLILIRRAVCVLATLLAVAGCGSDDGQEILRTCGNGQVEKGEECDDGGSCVGGLNPNGSCLIGEPDSCPGFSGSCSLVPGAGGFCRGGPLDGAACGDDAQCCPGEGGGCGVRCIGACLGGPNNGTDCTADANCGVSPGVCTLVDTDSCTSVCRLPVCGDGVINPGLEQCENFDLGGATCSTLQLGSGELKCDDECRFDPSQCGAPFTATPTDTPLPTATASPTQTNTFLPGFTPATATPVDTPTPSPTSTPETGPICGNGLLEVTENYIDPNPAIGQLGDPNGFACDVDAVVQDCVPSAEKFTVQLDLTAFPTGATVTGISVFAGYRSSAVSIPGTGLVGVRPSVRVLVPGTFNPNDRDFGLRVVLLGTEVLRTGPFATITFEVCDGAVPSLEDVSCIVEVITGTGGSLPAAGSTCEVLEVAP